MEIVLSDLDYCKISINYKADAETVKEKRNFVAKEMVKNYEVKGFRKGKASPEVIKLSYPKEVETHLKQEMINKAFSDAVVEKNIKPFGGPSLETATLNGNTFECALTVHTLPEFELKDYKGFDIPKHDTGTTVDDLAQQILQELRVEHAPISPVWRKRFCAID